MRSLGCMFPRIAALFVFLLPGVLPAQDAPVGRLDIRPEAAVVDWHQTARDRRLVTLPEVSFPLSLQAVCSADTAIEFVSVSATDTRLVLRADSFDTDGRADASLVLPGEQLAPLGLDAMCAAEDADHGARPVLVAGAFSAHASLLCIGESRRRIVYETLALDVRIECGAPETAMPDQSPAAESVSF